MLLERINVEEMKLKISKSGTDGVIQSLVPQTSVQIKEEFDIKKEIKQEFDVKQEIKEKFVDNNFEMNASPHDFSGKAEVEYLPNDEFSKTFEQAWKR